MRRATMLARVVLVLALVVEPCVGVPQQASAMTQVREVVDKAMQAATWVRERLVTRSAPANPALSKHAEAVGEQTNAQLGMVLLHDPYDGFLIAFFFLIVVGLWLVIEFFVWLAARVRRRSSRESKWEDANLNHDNYNMQRLFSILERDIDQASSISDSVAQQWDDWRDWTFGELHTTVIDTHAEERLFGTRPWQLHFMADLGADLSALVRRVLHDGKAWGVSWGKLRHKRISVQMLQSELPSGEMEERLTDLVFKSQQVHVKDPSEWDIVFHVAQDLFRTRVRVLRVNSQVPAITEEVLVAAAEPYVEAFGIAGDVRGSVHRLVELFHQGRGKQLGDMMDAQELYDMRRLFAAEAKTRTGLCYVWNSLSCLVSILSSTDGDFVNPRATDESPIGKLRAALSAERAFRADLNPDSMKRKEVPRVLELAGFTLPEFHAYACAKTYFRPEMCHMLGERQYDQLAPSEDLLEEEVTEALTSLVLPLSTVEAVLAQFVSKHKEDLFVNRLPQEVRNPVLAGLDEATYGLGTKH